MPGEVISLVINGMIYSAWKSFSARGNFGSPEITFQVAAADEAAATIGAAFTFEPNMPVQVYATVGMPTDGFVFGAGDLIVDGFIDESDYGFDEQSHTLTISGTGKGQDCVDCSVDHPTHEWKNKALDEIGNDTGNNTEFEADDDLPKIDKVRANPGETVFKFLNRHSRAQGMYLTGTRQGPVKIGKAGKQRHAGAIVEGINWKRGKVKLGGRQRFSKHKHKSQRMVGTGKRATQIMEEAEDDGARPGRVKRLMPNAHLDRQRAKTSAQTASDRTQGESVQVHATLVGFRDDGGNLWEAGWLVYCESADGHVSQDLAVKSWEFTQNDHMGTLAQLELCDPRALGGKGAGKVRSATAVTKGLSGAAVGRGK